MFEDLLSDKHEGTVTISMFGDPGKFNIHVTIGCVLLKKALCDLGVGVSLISYSLYKKIGNVGKLAPDDTKLQLTDRSLIYPKGILMDVSVAIGRSMSRVTF